MVALLGEEQHRGRGGAVRDHVEDGCVLVGFAVCDAQPRHPSNVVGLKMLFGCD